MKLKIIFLVKLFAVIFLSFYFTGCFFNSKNTEQSPINNSELASNANGGANSGGKNQIAAPRVLDQKFYIDGDGNAIPDFLETELGFDPLADDCPYKDCGKGADGEKLDLREQNTLLILDSSGSMRAQNKMSDAKKALSRYVKTISGVQNLGFMVYGHRGDNSQAGARSSLLSLPPSGVRARSG